MRNITKLQGSKFANQVCEGLLEMGATCRGTKNERREFVLETIVGKLTITIPLNQSIIYSVFSRFENVELAKTKFACNRFSGKYNINISNIKPNFASDVVLNHFEMTLNN